VPPRYRAAVKQRIIILQLDINRISNLIVQWGYDSATSATATSRQASFATTFNNVFCVNNCNGSFSAAHFSPMTTTSFTPTHLTYSAGVRDVTNSGFTEQAVFGFYYIAIGN